MVATYTPAVKGFRGISDSTRSARTLWPTCVHGARACVCEYTQTQTILSSSSSSSYIASQPGHPSAQHPGIQFPCSLQRQGPHAAAPANHHRKRATAPATCECRRSCPWGSDQSARLPAPRIGSRCQQQHPRRSRSRCPGRGGRRQRRPVRKEGGLWHTLAHVVCVCARVCARARAGAACSARVRRGAGRTMPSDKAFLALQHLTLAMHRKHCSSIPCTTTEHDDPPGQRSSCPCHPAARTQPAYPAGTHSQMQVRSAICH
eukprot:1154202-Pelagomonas_calceolata.AAC.9